jgi:hypothetical protein
MLVYRTISGTLRNAGGDLLKNRPVFFKPVGAFGSAGDIVPERAIKCLTDNNGFFSCQILTTDAQNGFIRYEFTFPNGTHFLFDLIAGSPVTIDELLNLSLASQTSTQAAFENAVQSALSGSGFVTEQPSGQINGSNAVFATAHAFIPESVKVYLNGLRQKTPDEFQTNGNSQIQLTVSPIPGETLQVDYLRG